MPTPTRREALAAAAATAGCPETNNPAGWGRGQAGKGSAHHGMHSHEFSVSRHNQRSPF